MQTGSTKWSVSKRKGGILRYVYRNCGDNGIKRQAYGSGNPAIVVIENVDSAQQPNTPTSQVIGSLLALDELIGTTPEGH